MSVSREQLQTLAAAVRAEAWRRDFYRFFVECAWPALNPATKLVSNWHIQAICEYLQAVSRREIRNLIVNIMPRMLKSSVISQAFPAWEWATHPEIEYFTASYAKDVATRDAVASRTIIQSPAYQIAFGGVFRMTGDQNVKTRYTNDRRGTRVVSSPDAAGTAFGGNRIIIDDPINAADASNVKANKAVVEWWKGAASTRLNDPSRDAIIVTHQRTFPDDLTGYLIETEPDFTVLRLPLRYDPKIVSLGAQIYPDPRTTPGELLFPARLNEAEARKIENRSGAFHAAAQLQQNPTHRSGHMFDVTRLRILEAVPPGVGKWVRAWDLAATEEVEGGTARTAGLRVGLRRVPGTEDDEIIIAHGVAEHTSPDRQRALILAIAQFDGPSVPITLPQDPGQAGKVQGKSLVAMLNRYTVEATPESGDKITRADAPAAQMNVGNVCMVRGDWNESVIEELRGFPAIASKDYVDALSRAYHYLTGAPASLAQAVGGLIDRATAPNAYQQAGLLPRLSTRVFK